MLHTDFFEPCLSYIRGFLTDFVEPAKGSLTPGDPGGVRIAVRVGEEGGDESMGSRDGELAGEGVREEVMRCMALWGRLSREASRDKDKIESEVRISLAASLPLCPS